MSRFLDQIRKAKEMRRQAGQVPPVGKEGEQSPNQAKEPTGLVPEKQALPPDATPITEPQEAPSVPSALFPSDIEQKPLESRPTAKIIAASIEAADVNLFPDELENVVSHLEHQQTEPSNPDEEFEKPLHAPDLPQTPNREEPVSPFEQLPAAAMGKPERGHAKDSDSLDLDDDFPNLIPDELSDLELHGGSPTSEERSAVASAALDSAREALAEALERFESEKPAEPIVKPQRISDGDSEIHKIEAQLEREWQAPSTPAPASPELNVADPHREPVLERARLRPEMRPRASEISVSAQSQNPPMQPDPVRVEISVPAAVKKIVVPDPVIQPKAAEAEIPKQEVIAPLAAPKPAEPKAAAPARQSFSPPEAEIPLDPASPSEPVPVLPTVPVFGTVGTAIPRRLVKAAAAHRRKSEPLFPPELETEIYSESADEDDMPQEDSTLLPRNLSADDEDEARRRKRRKVLVSGGQADAEFVKRIAKVALNPDRRVLAYYEPTDHVCEEYRLLGKNILHTFAEGAPSCKGRCLVLSSAVRGEGKTMTSVNLALTISQDLVDRVLLIDGDMRHPKVHRYLGVPGGSGLNDLLAATDPGSIMDDCLLRTDMGLHLLLSTATGKNPAPLLDSRQMIQIFNLLREKYSLIIVDTPPILLATDALTLGVKSDAMLFLMRARKTQREQIQEARQRIARLDIRLMGYVINNVKTFLPRIWSRYYYGNY